MEQSESPPNGKIKNPLHGKRITELMAAQLSPDGIMLYEPLIRDAISMALPERMRKNNDLICDKALNRLRSTELQAWMLGASDGEKTQVAGVGFTEVIHDHWTGEKQLHVTFFTMFHPFEPEALSSVMPVIEKYARMSGCKSLSTTIDVNNRRAMMSSEAMGFDIVRITGFKEIENGYSAT